MEQRFRAGVVADDITGANDIGLMFSQGGLSAAVVSLKDQPREEDFADAGVWIVNTDSRLDSPELAAQKSAAAARFLRDAGCRMIYTKTCSVFRGNVGASFDAVQDVLGVRCSMVAAGFPENGRTTVDGLHYVYGVLLENSAFASDPVNPMHLSRLSDIIGRQSSRPCGAFDRRLLDLPPAQRKERFETLKRSCAYIVFDVRHQRDLQTIAALVKDERNLCGSSALARELPAAWGLEGEAESLLRFDGAGAGILVVAGSLTPQTFAQVENLKRRGMPCWAVDPMLLFDAGQRQAHLAQGRETLGRYLRAGEDALAYALRNEEQAKARGRELGMSDAQVGRMISSAFHDLSRWARRECGVKRFAVAGGETSSAVSAGLGVRSMRIWQEIEPGVPLMTARCEDSSELMLVLKSGSFGSDGFLLNAVQLMRRASEGHP